MAVTGKPRAVTAAEIPRLTESDGDIRGTLVSLGKKIGWNTAALNTARQEIADIRQLFSDSMSAAEEQIDQVYTKVDDVPVTVKGRLDDYDDLVQQVSVISGQTDGIAAGVSSLAAAGISADSWNVEKNKVADLSLRISGFSRNRKRAPFVDLGTVTLDTLGDILQERVTRSFGAVRGTLEDDIVTGWWIRQGDSGSGLLLNHNSSKIFSLFKRSNGTVDIKVIYDSVTGTADDISFAERALIAGLISAGLSAETWNETVTVISDIWEKQKWYNLMRATDIGMAVWEKLLSDIVTVKSIAEILSVKDKELSAAAWRKVMSWQEENDTLSVEQQNFLANLQVAGLSAGTVRKLLADISVLTEIADVNIPVAVWQEVSSFIAGAKDIVKLISAVRAAGLNPEVWKTINDEVINMTTEERNFLNELMSSSLSSTTWSKALEDILALQTTKTYVDALISAGLSAESWTAAKQDIENLLEVKTFVDELKAAGFSADSWSAVYAAALSAAAGDETPDPTPDPEPEGDITLDGKNVTISNGAHYTGQLEDGALVTIVNEGYVNALHVVTDTPLTFSYGSSRKGLYVTVQEDGEEKTDHIFGTDYAVTVSYSSADGYSMYCNSNAFFLFNNYTRSKLTYYLNDAVLHLYNIMSEDDGQGYIYSLGASTIQLQDKAYTMSDFNGVIRDSSSYVPMTVNGKTHTLSDSATIYCVDEEQRSKLNSVNKNLLKYCHNFSDVYNVYPYSVTNDSYSWEADFVPSVETEPVTTPLGDEDSPVSNMALRVFRAYFKALCTNDCETLYYVNDVHNVALTAIGAKHDLDYYAKKFVYTVRQLYATCVETADDRAEGFKQLLKELCNMDLDNNDSGAIIGLDAGGALEKQYRDIIQDPISDVSQEYPADVFTAEDDTRYVIVKGITFVLPSPDTLEGWQKRLICELAYWYFEAIMNVLEDDVFGVPLNFAAKHFDNVIKFVLTDDLPSGTYARTSKSEGYITIEFSNSYMSRFGSVSGEDETTETIPPDNGLFHEMVHVYQEVNLLNSASHRRLSYYGSWFVEGGAEFASAGIDHNRALQAQYYYDPGFWFVAILSRSYNMVNKLYNPYLWGTVFMRWYFKTLAEERQAGV